MELKLSDAEIPTVRKMIAIQDRNSRHPTRTFVLMIGASVIFFSISIFAIVKYFEANRVSEMFTQSCTVDCETTRGVKNYVDKKIALEKFAQYSFLMALWKFFVGMTILTAAILVRRRALVEPVQIRVLRSLLNEYDENSKAGRNA